MIAKWQLRKKSQPTARAFDAVFVLVNRETFWFLTNGFVAASRPLTWWQLLKGGRT
jgi:hypothetical protein